MNDYVSRAEQLRERLIVFATKIVEISESTRGECWRVCCWSRPSAAIGYWRLADTVVGGFSPRSICHGSDNSARPERGLKPATYVQNTIPKPNRTLSMRCPFSVNGKIAPATVSVRSD